jgi:hypothetical protein
MDVLALTRLFNPIMIITQQTTPIGIAKLESNQTASNITGELTAKESRFPGENPL